IRSQNCNVLARHSREWTSGVVSVRGNFTDFWSRDRVEPAGIAAGVIARSVLWLCFAKISFDWQTVASASRRLQTRLARFNAVVVSITSFFSFFVVTNRSPWRTPPCASNWPYSNVPRPKLNNRDRLFWIRPHLIWQDWKSGLMIVPPETVTSWHR